MSNFLKFLFITILILSIISTFFITKTIYDKPIQTIIKPVPTTDTIKITKSVYLPGKIKYIKKIDSVLKVDTMYLSTLDSLLLDSLLTRLENIIAYADTTVDSMGSRIYIEYFFPPKNKFFVTLENNSFPTIPTQPKSSPIQFGLYTGPGIGYGTKKWDVGVYAGIGILIKF